MHEEKRDQRIEKPPLVVLERPTGKSIARLAHIPGVEAAAPRAEEGAGDTTSPTAEHEHREPTPNRR